MAQDTTLSHGKPGIAMFATQSYGGPSEPRFGDTPAPTTSHTVTAGADLDLSLYSVVSIIAGVLALAGSGTVQGAASQTVTFSTAAPANNDTVTVNGRVYTFKTALSTGPAVAYEVLAGADITAAAANLVRAINDTGVEATNYGTGTAIHPDVSATSSAGIVTLVARDPGDEGNALTLAKSGTNIAVGGATFVSGSDDPDALPFGILAMPVVMTNGQSMSVEVYRGGHWDMDQLVWGPTFVTEAQKKAAFENSRSPAILVSKKKYNNDQIVI